VGPAGFAARTLETAEFAPNRTVSPQLGQEYSLTPLCRRLVRQRGHGIGRAVT